MSTPTLTTASLPLASHYPRPAHYNAYYYTQPSNASTTTYASHRAAAHATANSSQSVPLTITTAAPLVPAKHPAPAYPISTQATSSYAPSSTSATHTGPTSAATVNDFAVASNSSVAHSQRQDLISLPDIRESDSSNDPAYLPTSPCTTMAAAGVNRRSNPLSNHSQSGLKRRRDREDPVDWTKFYGGQPPKEIIVIDDTPEPDAAAASASQALINTANTTYTYTNGSSVNTVADANISAARHAPKRRRREEDAPSSFTTTRYDPVHHNTTTPRQTAPPTHSVSAIPSSDRTNSAIHTTAASSLGPRCSNGNGQYQTDVSPGQKRKRNTRQQVANEVKRRENAVTGQNYPVYNPPPNPPKKAGEVHVRIIPDKHSKNAVVDSEDGHYNVVADADLTDNYTIMKLLGQGTFGKVVQATDRRKKQLVAVKIIRSVQKYRDASRIELRVLATLKANDPENRNRCIHLRDCFDYRGHICIVMDLLGQSVFDFLKGNSFVPFPNSQIQSFARQLLTSVAFLHDLNLIHTDLKPENILLVDPAYQTFTYNRHIPSSSTTSKRHATQRRVLLDTEIRLIDFGSATFQDEYHSSVVSTRHYRAPEIILGLGWSFPCDIWSIGCILVEFYTGDALFQTHENLEHLAMMESVVGTRIDHHLIAQINKMTRNGGNPASKFFKRGRLEYPQHDTTRASRRFVKAMKRLDEIMPNSSPFLTKFKDLLKKIFVYDPAHRITAKEALQHPWFKETAHPDDGTEAAKIKIERLRKDPLRSAHG